VHWYRGSADVVEYGGGTVTPAVNFTVNVSDKGGVSPALEYFEFVFSHSHSFFIEFWKKAYFQSIP